jgi:hypothetical protein
VRPFLVSNSRGRRGTIAETPMLGVVEMSAAMPAGADGDGLSNQQLMEAAAAQLKRVMDLLDAAKAPPEFAARVQEAIDALEVYRSA